MTADSLSGVSVADLISRFTAAALAQYHADMDFNIKTINKAVKEMMAIAAELKARPGDQRSALLQLYDHPNTRVRLSAARLSFALAPVRARAVIQAIAELEEVFDRARCRHVPVGDRSGHLQAELMADRRL